MQFTLHSKCFYEPMKTHSHPADPVERKRKGKAERGRIRKEEHIMIIFVHWIVYLYLESYRPLWGY